MVNCALSKPDVQDPDLADTIGIWTSGSIFDEAIYPNAQISVFNVHQWLPYHNRVHLVKVSGTTLKKIFGTSGGAIGVPSNGQKDWGQFLQVSNGVEVVYSTSGELRSLKVHHLNNDSQTLLKDVDDQGQYDVVLPSFMSRGRSVYDYIPDALVSLGGKKIIDIGE